MYQPVSKNTKISYLKRRQRKGSKIVFTNGCFDLIHIGHVDLFMQASAYGDCLVVGLNSDKSIKQIKGDNRPINCEEFRYLTLQSIVYISDVIIFDELTPLKLIEELGPDVLVKGSDWDVEDIIGANLVKQKGGIVKTVPFAYDVSTSKIIEKIKEIES